MFVIAGASGRTGGVVAERLLALGQRVRVVVRNPRDGERWRLRGATAAVAALDDAHGIEQALANASGFFVLMPEDARVPDFHAHRRRMSNAIAAAVRTSGVPHVVFLSGAAAAVADGNGLARELHHLETLLFDGGRTVTAIRAVAFQENVAWALPAALGEGIYPNFYPTADFEFPMVATGDIGWYAAHCLVEAAGRSEVIDMLGPRYSVRQVADMLGSALHRTLRIVDIPAPRHVDALNGAGMPRPFAESLAELIGCLASGRISPSGDRAITGTTRLENILPRLIVDGSQKSGTMSTSANAASECSR
jgi:uncharacterized protein YbjT (DUF2867 family)